MLQNYTSYNNHCDLLLPMLKCRDMAQSMENSEGGNQPLETVISIGYARYQHAQSLLVGELSEGSSFVGDTNETGILEIRTAAARAIAIHGNSELPVSLNYHPEMGERMAQVRLGILPMESERRGVQNVALPIIHLNLNACAVPDDDDSDVISSLAGELIVVDAVVEGFDGSEGNGKFAHHAPFFREGFRRKLAYRDHFTPAILREPVNEKQREIDIENAVIAMMGEPYYYSDFSLIQFMEGIVHVRNILATQLETVAPTDSSYFRLQRRHDYIQSLILNETDDDVLLDQQMLEAGFLLIRADENIAYKVYGQLIQLHYNALIKANPTRLIATSEELDEGLFTDNTNNLLTEAKANMLAMKPEERQELAARLFAEAYAVAA